MFSKDGGSSTRSRIYLLSSVALTAATAVSACALGIQTIAAQFSLELGPKVHWGAFTWWTQLRVQLDTGDLERAEDLVPPGVVRPLPQVSIRARVAKARKAPPATKPLFAAGVPVSSWTQVKVGPGGSPAPAVPVVDRATLSMGAAPGGEKHSGSLDRELGLEAALSRLQVDFVDAVAVAPKEPEGVRVQKVATKKPNHFNKIERRDLPHDQVGAFPPPLISKAETDIRSIPAKKQIQLELKRTVAETRSIGATVKRTARVKRTQGPSGSHHIDLKQELQTSLLSTLTSGNQANPESRKSSRLSEGRSERPSKITGEQPREVSSVEETRPMMTTQGGAEYPSPPARERETLTAQSSSSGTNLKTQEPPETIQNTHDYSPGVLVAQAPSLSMTSRSDLPTAYSVPRVTWTPQSAPSAPSEERAGSPPTQASAPPSNAQSNDPVPHAEEPARRPGSSLGRFTKGPESAADLPDSEQDTEDAPSLASTDPTEDWSRFYAATLAKLSPPGAVAVEAFEWITRIDDAKTTVLSAEGVSSFGSRRWLLTRAGGHLSTLSWDSRHVLEGPIPLISRNTHLTLARLSRSELKPDTAVVFGAIPAGWKVELTGTHGGVLYFDRNQGILPEDRSQEDRHFAFLNVAPGAPQLVLSAVADNSKRMSLRVPAVGDVATYLILGVPSPQRISGRVYHAASMKPRGLSSVALRVEGQESVSTVTGAGGRFVLEGVLTLNDHPVYLEADRADSYVHRYRAWPQDLEGLRLYFFSPRQIFQWLNQLKGGVSAESGLVIGALPIVTRTEPNRRLFPTLQALLPDAPLVPETYTLSEQDELRVATPLASESPRFLSVQVALGPHLAQIQDEERSQVWSQLVFGEPGVVSVVGPNP